jgi:hypothetical protein
MNELVTIAEFDDFHRAHIFKSKLENEGIFCVLLNQNMFGLFPIPGSHFTIQVQVRLEDGHRALDLFYELEP